MLVPIVWMIIGLGVLIAGGELLVRGATSLAAAMGISPLVIGLTVVAFGTSAPELAVSLQSVLNGQEDVAVGNVVGSNIANVLLILGVSAIVAPLVVASQLIRLDVPLMVTASFILLAMGLDGTIGRTDGCVLFGLLLCYVTWLVRTSRKESARITEEYSAQMPNESSTKSSRLLTNIGWIVIGLIVLALGSRWFVSGAVSIARTLGVSELVIGLTVVAIGTSLPEIVTSLTASFRGARDIAVGNVVGSNLFNILCVLGLSSILAPNGVRVSTTAVRFDIPIMTAVAVACLPIFFTGNKIARWEGALFLGYYVAYTLYLVLDATQATVTRTFATIMVAFVIPLTIVTLAIGVVRAIRAPVVQ